MIFTPHNYQRQAARFALERSSAGLFMDPGLGKTATTLSILSGLRRLGGIRRVLVIAPLRVVYSVWPVQCDDWRQFNHLNCSIVHGTRKQRANALKADADLYLINPEGIEWLIDQQLPDFDYLVIDESTKFKSASSKRFKALQKILDRFPRRMILTGTPSPNGLMDLWAQVYVLDQGERLGRKITHFRDRFFTRGGYENREYFPIAGAKEKIESLISDIVLRLDAKDLLDLPELIVNDMWVDLPAKVLKAYKKLEKQLFFELDNVDETALSSSSAYLMCRQIANGGLYTEDGDETVHNTKIDAVADLAEELQGKPLLVCYQFKHELKRLLKRFPNTPFIAGGVSPKQTDAIVNQWNAGQLPLLFVQPQAMSHGLNMQKAGNDVAWLGLTDDLEIYLQTNARIYRQGVVGGVRIHRILAKGTVDKAVRARIDRKDADQQSLLSALKSYAKNTGLARMT